jgi:hypothetical protein
MTDRFFPHVRADFDKRVAAGAPPSMALSEALLAVPGIQIGRTETGLDIAIPTVLRSRHLVIWGRSGAGKSCTMLHLAKGDIDEGRAVVIFCPESEVFPSLLGLGAKRAGDVIYLAPADPSCPVTFNPLRLEKHDVPADHAPVLFTAMKRALGEESIGPRADALLANAIGLALHRPRATLETIRTILTDSHFREQAVAEVHDEYLRRFWLDVFPTFPSNGSATAPLLTRLDAFLRVSAIRRTLTDPQGSFTIQEVIENRKILLVDLSGLTPEMTLLLGGLLTARLELALVGRQRGLAAMPAPVSVYADEFPVVCGLGEGSWASLLSRSRKYNVSLCLLGQFPHGVPVGVRRQIAANVASMLTFSLGARDSSVMSHELLVPAADGAIKAVNSSDIVGLPIGTALLRIGNSACALKVILKPPLARPSPETVTRVREESWRRYAPVAAEVCGREAFLSSKPAASTQPGSTPGRGGAQHKLLQQVAHKFGEERGFRATLEETILGGAGRVDVSLVRGDVRVAVEVGITSTPNQVAASVNKSLAAGFSHVVVLSRDAATLRHAEPQIAEVVGAADRHKIHLFTPDELPAFLDQLPGGENPAPSVAGYTVTVGHAKPDGASQHARRRNLARLVATALLRRRWSS